jgi:predicted nucleotidyltransferase/fructose-specific component phosphotransferase system IIB-like protein
MTFVICKTAADDRKSLILGEELFMTTQILPHHRATIDKVTAHFRADPRYRALIIGGSVVKGLARPDSDVDIMVITTDDEYARLSQHHDLTFYTADLSTYDGGFVDGKFLDHDFLLSALDRGSEPTRWSFSNAIIAFSDIPDLDALIKSINQYPLAEQQAKIRSFYGQFYIAHYFVQGAVQRDNRYMMTRATADMVLFGSRMILAHNRMLFPYHKWMMTEIERAADKPENFVALADELLRSPTLAIAKAFLECVTNFRDWGVTTREGVNAFTEDSERAWLTGRPALTDW